MPIDKSTPSVPAKKSPDEGVKLRPRSPMMDVFMAKVHASPRFEAENVTASMSKALESSRTRAKTRAA